MKKKSHTSGEILHTVFPPFYHRDWVFLGLTNTVRGLGEGGGGAVSPPIGVLGSEAC